MTDARSLEAVNAIVRRSGSSFYWAMRLLPKPQRDAMFAIYAFCRDLDDITDGDAPKSEKRQKLDAWRAEIAALYEGTPSHPIAVALAEPVRTFDLERTEFEELIAGMEMDVDDDIKAPALDTLHLYCRRVAGAVGMLAIRVFGCADAEARKFAEALGEALQLTNILRDISEDARIQRLYLPREVLCDAGITDTDPGTVIGHPSLPAVCDTIAAMAERRYMEAREALAKTDAAKLRPAVIMMTVYHKILDKLRGRGWTRLDERPHLNPLYMLGVALRLRFVGS